MKKGRVIILIIRIFFSLLWILHQSQILWNHSNVHSERSDDRTKRENNFRDLGYPWSWIVSMWGDSCNIQNKEPRQKHLHDHICSRWYASIQTRENATFRGQIMWSFKQSSLNSNQIVRSFDLGFNIIRKSFFSVFVRWEEIVLRRSWVSKILCSTFEIVNFI